jgi:hypothetical protein
MKVDIRPETFVVSALSGSESDGFTVDTQASNTLLRQTQIPIDSMREVALLRPYLKLALTGGTEKMIVAVRFRCQKNQDVIHSLIVGRKYLESIILNPLDVADLRPYQSRNRLLGNWRIVVEVALLGTKTLAQIAPSSYEVFLAGLRYQELAVFDFEIVRNSDGIELTATGRMTRPRRDTGTTYTINDL